MYPSRGLALLLPSASFSEPIVSNKTTRMKHHVVLVYQSQPRTCATIVYSLSFDTEMGANHMYVHSLVAERESMAQSRNTLNHAGAADLARVHIHTGEDWPVRDNSHATCAWACKTGHLSSSKNDIDSSSLHQSIIIPSYRSLPIIASFRMMVRSNHHISGIPIHHCLNPYSSALLLYRYLHIIMYT